MEFVMLENNDDLEDALCLIDNVLFNLSEAKVEPSESIEWQSDLKEARTLISKVFQNNLFRELVYEEGIEYDRINGLEDSQSL